MNRVKIFSHSDLDGIGCVILAQLVFGKENVDYEICNYDDVNGKIREFYLCNQELYDAAYITDISVDDEVAEEINNLVEANGNWYLLDHHATALRLNKYKWADVRVELEDSMKTSGTELFYEHLMENGYFKDKPVNVLGNIHRFVEIVRDYDTWRWKTELGDDGVVCKQVNDLFHIYGREKFIDVCLNQLEKPLYTCIEKQSSCGSLTDYEVVECSFPYFSPIDKALLEQKQKEIDIYVYQKEKQLTAFVDKFGYTYGVVFIERFASEVGNRLHELHPELAYIAMINLSDGTVNYRTTRDDIDLGGEIAHSFGGGGHRKAAGSQFDSLGAMIQIMNWLNGFQDLSESDEVLSNV